MVRSAAEVFVLNTAVLYGRAARQIWILDMDDATPELDARWKTRRCSSRREIFISLIPEVPIGRDTLLRDNPSCPVRTSSVASFETPPSG